MLEWPPDMRFFSLRQPSCACQATSAERDLPQRILDRVSGFLAQNERTEFSTHSANPAASLANNSQVKSSIESLVRSVKPGAAQRNSSVLPLLCKVHFTTETCNSRVGLHSKRSLLCIDPTNHQSDYTLGGQFPASPTVQETSLSLSNVGHTSDHGRHSLRFGRHTPPCAAPMAATTNSAQHARVSVGRDNLVHGKLGQLSWLTFRQVASQAVAPLRGGNPALPESASCTRSPYYKTNKQTKIYGI
jgi:hypothetical protein